MKRFFCMCLVLLMFVPSAYALNIDDFNLYAGVFGEAELSDGKEKKTESGIVTKFDTVSGLITFTEKDGKLNSINIYGKGDDFISYCCAAIMTADTDSKNASENFGAFIMNLQLTKGAEGTDPRYFNLVSGTICAIAKNADYGYRLMVMR